MFKNNKLHHIILSGLSIGLFIPIIITFYLFSMNNEKEQLHKMQLIAESTKISAIESLWFYSEDWTNIIVHGAIKNPKISEAEIYNSKKILVSKASEKIFIKNTKKLSIPLKKNNKFLGTLVLTFNIDAMNNDVFVKEIQLLSILIMQAVVSSLIIFFIIKFKILDPIKLLIHQSKLLKNKKLNKEFNWKQKDEIGQLGKAMDNTRKSLKSIFLKLEEKATYDNLTKTYNRHGLEAIYIKETKRTNRNKYPISLIMFDIDFFKKINDKHGHLVGDNILIKICEEIQGIIRKTDYIIRWGGEEFIILCPRTELNEAIKMAEKLRLAIEEKKLENVGSLTISLAVTQKEKNETSDKIIKRVDDLLYKAKESGRNKVCF